MIALLLAALTWAQEAPAAPWVPAPLPSPPTPREAQEGQCAKAYALRPGEAIPAELVEWTEDGVLVARCGAVAVPTSEAADALDAETWGREVYDLARLNEAQLGAQLRWRDQYIARLEVPTPWHQRPHAQRAFGRAEGLVLVLAAAWAVREVSKP